MDVSVLQLFVDVIRQGSFAAVARDRNLDPSSVSRAIAALEAELGIRLFQRTTRQLSPTEAGELSEVSVHGRTVISSAIALQQCAIAGMGLVLLPNWLIDDDLRAGTLVNAFPHYAVTATDFSTAAWLVYPSRTYVPLKVRVLIDFLKNSMGLTT